MPVVGKCGRKPATDSWRRRKFHPRCPARAARVGWNTSDVPAVVEVVGLIGSNLDRRHRNSHNVHGDPHALSYRSPRRHRAVRGSLGIVGASPDDPAPDPKPVRSDWSEEKLDAFAQAVAAVAEVEAIWRMRLTNAQTERQAQEFQDRMRAEVEEAIVSNGLSVETYNQIFEAARTNPEFRRELQKRADEAQE